MLCADKNSHRLVFIEFVITNQSKIYSFCTLEIFIQKSGFEYKSSLNLYSRVVNLKRLVYS